MARSRHLRRVIAWTMALGFLIAVATAHATAVGAVTAWTGGVDLYRAGTFTTQQSWLWCTAAGVQIVDNIVDHRKDHTATGQRRYFDWMRRHNRYALPLSAGVDAAGWTAGLRQFVDDRYRLVASTSFAVALRSAVASLRATNLPVALTVSHGNHGWILTGFEATADPTTTSSFTVTSVRVVGPLYGLQSKGGYDMPPDTKLTAGQLERYFTPWKYDPMPMIWDGRYVSIQPIGAKVAVAIPSAKPTAAATPGPSPTGAASATPAARPTSASEATPSAMAVVEASPTADPSDTAVAAAAATTSGPPGEDASRWPWLMAVVVVCGSILGITVVRTRLRRRGQGH